MAPPGRRELSKLNLLLPKKGLEGIRNVGALELHPTDFGLRWKEYFRKYWSDLYEMLAKKTTAKSHFVLEDNRSDKSKRKSWTMENTVKEYIDGFDRVLKTYKATLKFMQQPGRPSNASFSSTNMAIPTPQMRDVQRERESRKAPTQGRTTIQPNSTNIPRPSTSRGQPSPQRQSSTVPQTLTRSRGRPEVPSPVAGSKRKQSDTGLSNASPTRKLPRTFEEGEISLGIGGAQTSQPVRGSTSFLPFQDDDAASMAFSQDSQDSQADLIAAGVPIRDIKAQVISKMVKHIDNTTMLRIQHELKTIHRDGKWMKLTARIPITAGALNLVFFDHDQ